MSRAVSALVSLSPTCSRPLDFIQQMIFQKATNPRNCWFQFLALVVMVPMLPTVPIISSVSVPELV